MNGISELIDSLEVKFFKLNQKLVQLQKKNLELQEELLVSKRTQQNQSDEIASLESQLDTLKMVNSLLAVKKTKEKQNSR